MKYRQFEDLPVWREAADLARMMFEFTSTDLFRRHPGLRDQLERAALSISNNIAEGFERGTTNYIARGSAGEVRSMLRILESWNAFGDCKSQISNLRLRCERISKQLYGWIEQLKASEIRGQRHLDEKKRAAYTSRKERDEFLDELRRLSAKPGKE
jgi:four helix bundle protein